MAAGVVKKSGGGGRRRRRGSSAAMADINITPFVDVMLVLLIIFMVTAPMLQVGIPLEMPKTAAASLPTEQEEPLVVSITADGVLMIQTSEVSDAELIPKLTAVASQRTSDKIFVKADGALTYTRVAEVMGALSAAGFSNIGLVTDAGGPKMDGN
ncbi:MAG: protein TolR [Cypionkella sp.]|uniref:protein TolR n=1 Tax=Cypionkella sp. TaxID=2811411 RepID=UPI002AB83459|nr:protein TolR [Cypionkella sp.]MDZ4312372.1 protein TolR [Cypionkella sp.]MDZ4394242.1 protein TolR [Cypionkella sp.]